MKFTINLFINYNSYKYICHLEIKKQQRAQINQKKKN